MGVSQDRVCLLSRSVLCSSNVNGCPGHVLGQAVSHHSQGAAYCLYQNSGLSRFRGGDTVLTASWPQARGHVSCSPHQNTLHHDMPGTWEAPGTGGAPNRRRTDTPSSASPGWLGKGAGRPQQPTLSGHTPLSMFSTVQDRSCYRNTALWLT